MPVESGRGVVVSYFVDHLSCDGRDIGVALGCYFAHNDDSAGGAEALAGHAGVGIFLNDFVQYRIGNLVADLVGMSLGYRFGCK